MSRRGGVISSYVLLAAEVVSSVLFTPYLIRSLGQAEYGVYSLVGSITAYLMLLDAGVGNALIRYIAKYRVSEDLVQQRRLLGFSTMYYGAVGIAMVILGLALRGSLPSIFGQGLTESELGLASTLLAITTVNAALSLVFSAYERTLIAYERFVLSKSMAIAKLVIRVATLTALLYAGYRSEAVVLVNLVLTAAFGVVTLWLVNARLGVRPMFFAMRGLPVMEILTYSTFVFIQMAATQINSMTDQVLLGMMTTSVTVGIYAVGAQIAVYFQSIAASVNGVLMPGVVRLVETDAGERALFREMVKIGRLLLMFLGPIVVGFALCGRDFVGVWAGWNNVQAYPVALILMTPLLLVLTQSIGGQILWAMGRHKVQAVLKIGVAVTNIGLTIILIRWNPLIGASLGTAVAYIIGDILLLNLVFFRVIGVPIREYYGGLFKGIGIALLASGCIGWAVGVLAAPGWPSLVFVGGSTLLAYLVAMRLFGANEYERHLIGSLMHGRRAFS